jgi:hypothetical protein
MTSPSEAAPEFPEPPAAGWGVVDTEGPAWADPNPKDAIGRLKPGIHTIPPAALLHLGLAMTDGAAKYGLTNWRAHPVLASIYYDAAFRHLASWWDGEPHARDSKVHHLAHVMACCAILIDAEINGCLIEDKPIPSKPLDQIISEMTIKEEAPVNEQTEAVSEAVSEAAPGEEASVCVDDLILGAHALAEARGVPPEEGPAFASTALVYAAAVVAASVGVDAATFLAMTARVFEDAEAHTREQADVRAALAALREAAEAEAEHTDARAAKLAAKLAAEAEDDGA